MIGVGGDKRSNQADQVKKKAGANPQRCANGQWKKLNKVFLRSLHSASELEASSSRGGRAIKILGGHPITHILQCYMNVSLMFKELGPDASSFKLQALLLVRALPVVFLGRNASDSLPTL